jgi:hypothetical protein
VISWCGPLDDGFDRATNVTYDMLYNGWGTGIVLQVPRDSTNPTEEGLISWVDHVWEL